MRVHGECIFTTRRPACAQVRRVGTGLYKGLPAMLVGVPLQGAVRFTTLDAVKATLIEPGTQARRRTIPPGLMDPDPDPDPGPGPDPDPDPGPGPDPDPDPGPGPDPDPKQAGPVTNLVAGIMAGTLEAVLVVAPVETVKTRLVDADQVRGSAR